MANLASSLSADKDQAKYLGHQSSSDDDLDDEAKLFADRRMSMNKYNNLMDFHKYTETKPDAGVRREILNMFNEYKDQDNKEHARDELIDICEKYQIEKFQFVGYYFANSLAEKPDDFRKYINLVFEYFFTE